jgi:acetate kinase
VTYLLKQLTQGPHSLLEDRDSLAAVGHRVVHGGDIFRSSALITDTVEKQLEQLGELAPLHNPINVEGIAAARALWPEVPQVAVFDTAFHATLSEAARTYAIPYQWTQEWGLRRYGFHGLSHAYCSARAAELLGRSPTGLRLIICHLGQGCSLAAVCDGASVDTTMGFTPLDGLVMGTRSGAVDPGLLIQALRQHGLSAEQLDRALNHESGLFGISGISSDLRQVEAALAAGNQRARLAVDVFVHRLRQSIGAMAATLAGADALVFTAGIGEHSASTRVAACRELGWLGFELDAAANASCRPDADIATAGSRGRILVIATREDLTILRETVRVLGARNSQGFPPG